MHWRYLVVTVGDGIGLNVLRIALGVEVQLHCQHVARLVLNRTDGAEGSIAAVQLAAPVEHMILTVDADIGPCERNLAGQEPGLLPRRELGRDLGQVAELAVESRGIDIQHLADAPHRHLVHQELQYLTVQLRALLGSYRRAGGKRPTTSLASMARFADARRPVRQVEAREIPKTPASRTAAGFVARSGERALSDRVEPRDLFRYGNVAVHRRALATNVASQDPTLPLGSGKAIATGAAFHPAARLKRRYAEVAAQSVLAVVDLDSGHGRRYAWGWLVRGQKKAPSRGGEGAS